MMMNAWACFNDQPADGLCIGRHHGDWNGLCEVHIYEQLIHLMHQ
jgi:hypothetical protein